LYKEYIFIGCADFSSIVVSIDAAQVQVSQNDACLLKESFGSICPRFSGSSCLSYTPLVEDMT